MKQLFAKKSLKQLQAEAAGENRLRRVLGPGGLTALGVGAIIGTGIFVLVGQAAHDRTGPALILSFAVAGFACVLAALCYAEFAALVPVAGSAYTYAYATMGEVFAWIIGFDLALEYGVGASAVAHGWSKYFQDFLSIFKIHLPAQLSQAPISYDALGHLQFSWSFDLPAILITLLVTTILVLGIRESARFNNAMVCLKLAIVLFVIGVGAFFVNPANWHPFAPYGLTGIAFFGKTIAGQTGPNGAPVGMLAGAALIFFAFIGFDSISTHSEEAKNPRRDLPIAILTSLVVCTVLYIAVAAVLTGMVPYNQIDVEAPVSKAFGQVGLGWAQLLISLGAVAGMTSVLLVLMLSQARVLLAMARDGLLPESFFGAVHPKFRTPYKATMATGFFVGLLSGLLPLAILDELVNIGTLFAFNVVCIAVLIMRQRYPDAPRPFKVPLYPLVPILGIIVNTTLMLSLGAVNWYRLFGCLAVGLLIYVFYGRRHSALRKQLAQQGEGGTPPALDPGNSA